MRFYSPTRHRFRALSALAVTLVGALVATVLVVGGASSASAVGTRTISGHVFLGSTSTSAAAAEVYVHYTTSSSSLSAAPSVPTDASGNYVISALNSTTYYLYFEYVGAGGFSSMNWLNKPVGTSPTGINVYSTDQLGQDITLPNLAAISGTVSVGTVGTYPAPGDVSVRYQRYINSIWIADSAGVTTDASGNYSIPNLSAGVYRLHFVYLGAGGFQSKYWTSSFFINGSTSITFAAGVDLTGQSVTLLAPQSIVGHVYLGTTAASAGAGEVSITPSYYSADAGVWVELPGSATTTDASGNYSITGLNSATYRLAIAWLSNLSYFGQTSSNLTLGSAPSTTGNVTLARAFTYSGHVDLGSAAHPASAGEVRATLTPVGAGLTTTALTDSLGNFTITGIPAGSYTLRIHYLGAGDFPDYTSPVPLSISADLSGYVATLVEGNSISGTVTDSSGAPIAGATIVAEGSPQDPEPTYLYATTDALGNYSIKDLPDDNYIVQFSKVGYAPHWWGSATNFYVYWDLDQINAYGGGAHNGIDGVLYLDTTLILSVSGGDMYSEVFSSGFVTGRLQVFDEESGKWIDSYLNFTVNPRPWWEADGGIFEIHGVAPARYRVAVRYVGPLGVAFRYSTVVDVTEYHSPVPGLALEPLPTVTSVVLNPTPAQAPGTLVKGTGPTIYIVDGGQLVRVGSSTATADFGVPATYKTLPQAEMDNYFIAEDPLVNTVVCPDGPFFAAGGKLWPIDPSLVAGLPQTTLGNALCSRVPKSTTTIRGGLFVQSATSAATYFISITGEKRQVSGRVTMGKLSYPYAPIVVRAANSFLNSLPTGPSIAPYLGKIPYAGQASTPASSVLAESSAASSTLTIEPRVTCYTDYVQALGVSMFAPLAQTMTLDDGCLRELGIASLTTG